MIPTFIFQPYHPLLLCRTLVLTVRKAQFMAQEYKKRGGDYTTDKSNGQDESQANLSKWTEEEWQTKEGSGHAKKSDGTQKRYLPKKAWEQMSDGEKEATDEKKQTRSKEGKQFVGNTKTAKEARGNANAKEDKEFQKKKETQAEGIKTRGGQGNRKNQGEVEEEEDEEMGEKQAGDDRGVVHDGDEEEEEEEYVDDDEEDEDEEEDDVVDDEDDKAAFSGDDALSDEDDEPAEEDEKPTRGQKRSRGSNKSQGSANKKQKTDDAPNDAQAKGKMGSRHDNPDAPAPQGSSSRLPKVGQKVTWKAMPGWVHGKVLEIVREEKQMKGKTVKGSKDDPRLALEADSGKFCVHKPDGCYFEDE